VSHGDPAGFVDIHSHLVPGVDDGARDVAAAVESVERFTKLSIRRIVTTPHIDGSLTHHPARLEARLAEVSEAWERAAETIGARLPGVEYRRGHEVLLDVPEVDLSDPRLRLAGTSFVLVEWPRLKIPPRTGPVLERIRAMGYRPIVAHPERYSGIADAMHVVQEWRTVGAYLQVNYGSIVGAYGESARAAADRLLRRGWVDYLSSDFHGHARLEIHMAEATAALEALGAHEAVTALCKTNPGRVLSDEEPLPVPILPAERSFWTTLKGLVQGSGG